MKNLVGKYISDKIATSAWGDGIVKSMATYIAHNAPDLKGFSKKSASNVDFMRHIKIIKK